MAARLNGETLRWFDTLSREGWVAGLSDGQLLERFLSPPGSASEAAFEALVRRHGPMVRALCRGVLRNDHDTDDAFQATFLVLARRAATVRDHDRLATWLGRVARRIALRLREEAAHRQALEGRRTNFDAETEEGPASAALVAVETAALVRAEVDRLPEADRILMQLTYWQGKSYAEAAAAMSWPIGTVRSRLARARQRLRESLSRLGLAPALAPTGFAALAGHASTARLSQALIHRTVRSATRYAGGFPTAVAVGTVPASVTALVEGEFAMMTAFHWKLVAALLLVGGTMTAGAVSLAQRVLERIPPAASEPVSVPATPVARLAPEGKANARPLLTNGGIEEGGGDAPRAWSQGASIAGVEYIWSHGTAHGGKASLCLKKTAQRYFPIAQWSQAVDREGDNPRLKVSAWVKAEQAGKAILDAQFINGDGEWSHAWVASIGAREANDPPVSHDWKRYEGIVALPPGTRRIIIAPQIYGPGTVWFDDLDAEYTNDPTTDPIGS
jgi:RNA polymerase sigma factor (sigma-70 family)